MILPKLTFSLAMILLLQHVTVRQIASSIKDWGKISIIFMHILMDLEFHQKTEALHLSCLQ